MPLVRARRAPLATAAAGLLALATVPTAGAAAAVVAGSAPGRPGDAALSRMLLTAVAGAGFDRVVDFGPIEGRCPGDPSCPELAAPLTQVPQVDAAVIELDDAGRVTAAADVLLSRDHPGGWRCRWTARCRPPVCGGTAGTARGPTGSSVGTPPTSRPTTSSPLPRRRRPLPGPGAAGQRRDSMSPYPASLLQLMVAAGTLHLADEGRVDLDRPYHYLQAPGSTCLGARFSDEQTPRALLERMVTASDVHATCMLVKQLDDLGQSDAVTAWLRGLGLGTLQLTGTDAGSGGRWDVGRITMTAMDTARLLLLVRGAPGTLWHGPDGTAVTAAGTLSAGSRALLLRLLGEQGFNEVLSTTNWCGRDYPGAGIPQRVAPRWIDPATGTVTVDGIPYGQDVTPCNATAEVSFAHKTGVTYNFASDAGIVDSLPGARDRHYIVAVLSNLGYRYADPRYASSPTLPCSVDVCFTAAFARLGAAVDAGSGAAAAPALPPARIPAPARPGARAVPILAGGRWYPQ